MAAQLPQDEQPTRPATARERAFVEEYLRTWSAVKAAAACGYGRPSSVAHRVFNRPAVQAYLREQLEARSMGADEVLVRLTEHARGDIGDILEIGERGEVRLDLADVKARGLSHLIRSVKETKDGLHVELYDAQAALIALGRAHGLFVDKVDNTGTQLVRVYVRDADDSD